MDEKNSKNETEQSKKNYELVFQIVAIIVLVSVIGYNLGKVYGKSAVSGNAIETINTVTVSSSEIIPKGIPAVYGQELEVKYDDVSSNNPQLADETIAKLTQYEDRQLTQEQMNRYIKIGNAIACEYCCGAQSLIFSNGERACGCAHSYAMRGLAKYLLINHPNISDEEILSELGKWKVLFFPDIHEQKARALKAQGIDHKNYINLASNLYRGIEKGQSTGGSMVGGC